MRDYVADLLIERDGQTITRILKCGVVIWPTDLHTAAMQQMKAKEQEQVRIFKETELKEANLRLMEMGKEIGLTANSAQIGGNHYHRSDATGTCPKCGSVVQHWDWAHNLKGLEYAATKYIARWRDKGGLESLKKAIHYIQKLIEVHFPGTSVSVQYANRAGAGRETLGGEGVAQSTAAYPTAVKGKCVINNCALPDGHGGPHFDSEGVAIWVVPQEVKDAQQAAGDKKEYLRQCQESAKKIPGDLF